MGAQKVEPLVGFKNMRDILRELEDERSAAITSKVSELIDRSRAASPSNKIDGLAGHDKKDGGKDCGTDGKEGKESDTGKESCDPEFAESLYGDPAAIDLELLARAQAVKAERLRQLLSGSPII